MRIDSDLDQFLHMGNIDLLRDWGHTRDYVQMQWRILQQQSPEDFVIAPAVKNLCAASLNFPVLNLDGGNAMGR